MEVVLLGCNNSRYMCFVKRNIGYWIERCLFDGVCSKGKCGLVSINFIFSEAFL